MPTKYQLSDKTKEIVLALPPHDLLTTDKHVLKIKQLRRNTSRIYLSYSFFKFGRVLASVPRKETMNLTSLSTTPSSSFFAPRSVQ